ncbi:MAG TPA: ABC transporter permease [Acidimicrobiales bacterium]
MKRVAYALAPVAGVLTFLGLWQVLVMAFDVPRYQLVAPWHVVQHLADDPTFYLEATWVTAREAILGFAIAALAAVALASVAALLPFFERAANPVVVLLQVTPVIAYTPAVVIWLGGGLKPILVVTALVCFVPFYFNGVIGLRSVDPASLELLHSVDARRREIYWRLRLPHALPYLLSAARIAVGLALVGAVLGEYFALVSEGLGVALKKAQAQSDYDQLWGAIFSLALLGSVMTLLLGLLERRLLRWHSSQSTR